MKRLVILMIVGVMLGVTACGSKPSTEATDASSVETAGNSTTEESSESLASETETSLEYVEDTVISSELLTLKMPEEFKGKFLAAIDDDAICIYDKESNEAGYGGFVFSLAVDKDNTLIPGGMYTKVGELAASDGKIYNVCKGYPSEIQWDSTKYNDITDAVDYNKLYNAADDIISNVQANGNGTFMYGAGTKGEELYSYTVSKYIEALSSDWDANKYEEEGLSPEFYAIAQNEGDSALDDIGFAYKDITNDGVDELLVGPVSGSDEPSVIYDIYTMVNREPALVVSGTSRDRYYGLSYGGVANAFSGGANENGVKVYNIEPNSTELMHQYTIKYDAYTDEKNPWFISYSDDEEGFEAMTEEDYNSRLDMLDGEYLKLDYTPLSEIAGIDYSKVDLSKYGTFTNMLSDFKKGMGYANVKIGDTDVFFASTGTYEDENNKKNAIDSSLFMYTDTGIAYLGKIESAGTAYPLAVADGCVFTCGHHVVEKHTVKDGKLIIAEKAEETFDADGNATYSYTTYKDGEKNVDDDSELTRLFEEYEKAEVIEFGVEKP